MKKRILLFMFIAIVGLFAFQSNAYAFDVTCEALPNVRIDESIPKIVSTIIKAIQIVVPVLLIVFGSIDLVKGVIAQKEDEIKKGQQTLVKRLIAGAIVFFVIALVKILIGFVSDNGGVWDCACKFVYGPNSSSCSSSGSDPVETPTGDLENG